MSGLLTPWLVRDIGGGFDSHEMPALGWATFENQRCTLHVDNGLYPVATAIRLAVEGTRLGIVGGDARRLLLADLVIRHRLVVPQDPLNPTTTTANPRMTAYLLDLAPVDLKSARQVLARS